MQQSTFYAHPAKLSVVMRMRRTPDWTRSLSVNPGWRLEVELIRGYFRYDYESSFASVIPVIVHSFNGCTYFFCHLSGNAKDILIDAKINGINQAFSHTSTRIRAL